MKFASVFDLVCKLGDSVTFLLGVATSFLGVFLADDGLAKIVCFAGDGLCNPNRLAVRLPDDGLIIAFLGVLFLGDGLDISCDSRNELFLPGDLIFDGSSKLINFGNLGWVLFPDVCLCRPAILSANWKYFVRFLVLLTGPAE